MLATDAAQLDGEESTTTSKRHRRAKWSQEIRGVAENVESERKERNNVSIRINAPCDF